MEQQKPDQKQVELIQMIANGLQTATIASNLEISARTIESRLRKIRALCAAKSTLQAVLHFYRQGWIT